MKNEANIGFLKSEKRAPKTMRRLVEIIPDLF